MFQFCLPGGDPVTTSMQDPLRLAALRDVPDESPLSALRQITAPGYLDTFNHGDLPRWLEILAQLPELQAHSIDLKTGVRIGSRADGLAHPGQLNRLEALLREFIPWRKGPFELFGLLVDSEWQSGLKWERLLPHLEPLAGQRVLDVGCGNGYHCWRALGEGASLAIGLEPYLLYVMQFLAIRNFLADKPCHLLPIRLDQYPGPFHYFDTVLSMGVLYHVRSPVDHLLQLKKCLKPDGQLVIETLVVEGDEGYSLTPERRYARMSNIWFVPSIPTLQRWTQRCGFRDIRLVDSTITTATEQRSTSWMPFQSLVDGLNPEHPELTCEDLPAPRRAIVTARNTA